MPLRVGTSSSVESVDPATQTSNFGGNQTLKNEPLEKEEIASTEYQKQFM